MNVVRILIISVLVLAVSFFLQRKREGKLSTKEKLCVLLLPLVGIILSLFVQETRIAGTIEQTSYGWPHFFLIYFRRAIDSGEILNDWIFPQNGVLYLAANYIFFLSIVFLIVNVIKVRGKDNT